MSGEARVTWLLPVRDAMPHLPEALASIEAQTFRDWEVLAWDNGSADGSVEALRAWIPARLPGRVVTDKPFERLGACLRAMVEEARSELLARADADDINEPERLELQVRHLDEHPDHLAVGSWMRNIDASGRLGSLEDGPPADPREVRWGILFHNPVFHPTVCARRVAVLRAGNYAPMGMGQDWDLWCRLVQIGPIANLPRALVRHRVHAGSVSAAAQRDWPALNRALIEEHGAALFPGVAPEVIRAVWAFWSVNSDANRRDPPEREWVIAMATAAAKQAGWAPEDLLALPSVRRQLRRCRPRTWAEAVPHALVRLGSALRRRPR